MATSTATTPTSWIGVRAITSSSPVSTAVSGSVMFRNLALRAATFLAMSSLGADSPLIGLLDDPIP